MDKYMSTLVVAFGLMLMIFGGALMVAGMSR